MRYALLPRRVLLKARRKEVVGMTFQEAKNRASRLGLSAWVVEVVASGDVSGTAEMKRVGFASADLPIAEADTWEEALRRATRIIFSAR